MRRPSAHHHLRVLWISGGHKQLDYGGGGHGQGSRHCSEHGDWVSGSDMVLCGVPCRDGSPGPLSHQCGRRGCGKCSVRILPAAGC